MPPAADPGAVKGDGLDLRSAHVHADGRMGGGGARKQFISYHSFLTAIHYAILSILLILSSFLSPDLRANHNKPIVECRMMNVDLFSPALPFPRSPPHSFCSWRFFFILPCSLVSALSALSVVFPFFRAPGERQPLPNALYSRRYDNATAISPCYPSRRWLWSGNIFQQGDLRSSSGSTPKNAEFCRDFVEFCTAPCCPFWGVAQNRPQRGPGPPGHQ